MKNNPFFINTLFPKHIPVAGTVKCSTGNFVTVFGAQQNSGWLIDPAIFSIRYLPGVLPNTVTDNAAGYPVSKTTGYSAKCVAGSF